MNRLKLNPAVCALALLFCGLCTARAQYTDIVGATPGGGNIVTGSGNTLGAIASGGTLSNVGFDNLTFLPGSYANSMTADTVYFTTSDNTVVNGGTVSAGLGFNAFTFIDSSSDTLTNNGVISPVSYSTLVNVNIGGNFSSDSTGGNVGTGIDFVSMDDMDGIMVVNPGSITGGGVSSSLSNSSYGGNFFGTNSVGGNAADGMDFTSYLTVSGITVVNRGSVAGGSFGTITNSSVGENNQDTEDTGGNAGNGITMDGGALLTISVSNQGVITGGSFGTVTTSRVGSNNGNEDIGGDAANGIAATSFGSINALSFSNRGAISGGGITNNAGAFAGNYSGTNQGGNATSGMAFAGTSYSGFTLVNQGAISGGAIAANSGNIGGNYGTGDIGGNVSIGVSLTALGPIHGVTIANYGTITGGGISNNSSSIGSDHHNGVGGSVSDGVAITAGSAITVVSIFNSGTIAGGSISNDTGSIGGQHGVAGGDVGSGISFLSGGGGSNLSVINFGVIAGGSNLSDNAGTGILSNASNLTVTNWGAISAGAGANPFAVNLGGGNNTLNLNGHSSVNGPISAPGGSNNVLNLNFTGLSPAAQAALKASILAQNPLSNWSGTFTVRGVTYTVDPMIINFNLSSYQLQAITPNQFAIGEDIDGLTYNPAPGTSLFNLLNAIDNSGNVPGALEELSPQKFEIYGDLAIANASFTAASVDARLNNLRDGSESIDTSGIGGDTVAEVVTGNSKDDSSKESKEIQPAAPTPKQWGFFATGNGLFFRGNSHDADLQEGKADSAGTIAGIDGKVGDHGVIGALFAYNNADATLGADNSHATIESYTGGLYASYHNDGFYANGLAAYTRNNYKSERNITLPGFSDTADGSTNGNQYSANLDGGYDWNVTNRLTVGPVAGVQYVHMDVDGFNESGFSAADLALGSQNMNSLQSRVGLRANFHLATTQTSSFALDLHAAWQHEYLDDSRGISASFEGSGLVPFSVQTASPKRDAGVVGTGLNWTFHDRLTLFAEYELELWSTSYFEQTVNGGARISF